nr:two pore potassium channel protein sup-9-like [Onthophagus taurus]
MYYGSDPETLDRRNETVCSRFLKFTWKTITFFFSHITLVSMVVSYCILGAVTFEKLEKENEITVKKNISSIRHHIMDKLWNITYHGEEVLKEDTFINSSIDILNDFEQELIKAIKNHGWDGNEDLNKVQWNFAGSLFYSIIVITTIGK